MTKTETDFPRLEQLEEELKRERYKSRYKKVIRSTVYALITVAAVSVLVATLWMPVLQIYGSSMTPTLNEGQIVISVKTTDFKEGDIVAFYQGNKLLVKRYIAGPGAWVNIEGDGTVYVNDQKIDEPYLKEKAYGDCNIELPYQVPDGRIFVMGDHRSTSIDSRNTAVGGVSDEQIVGKIVFKIWPLSDFGVIN